jgi:2-amino-4-hydroxy-6-hydroxymethyldihydropteridine diphosphokinase/dihydropteroate synthase
MELLDALQSIEVELGRKKLIDKGPRSIDLDILLYDQEVFSHERLSVPHNLMLERDFVLRPLCQYVETLFTPTQSPNSFQVDPPRTPTSTGEEHTYI